MITQKKSRTDNSLQNTKISLLFYILTLATTFFSRKIFIDCLGTEVLGLNTTIINLLGLLNLTELGIGSAVSFALYKPLFENDSKSIREIISIQGWLYKNIAIFIICGAVLLMLFFPLIFQKTSLPLWYAYSTFLVLLFSSLLGYFVNYKQIILSADQKQYKITLVTKGLTLIKIIAQIVVIYFSLWGYQGWLLFEFLFSLIIAWGLDYLVKKNYPWLKTSCSEGKAVYKEHNLILTKTKQIFFHRIAGYVLNQTSPLIIYAYTTLTLVAVYGNYMLIVSGVISLLVSVFSGIVPTLGNLVAEGKQESIVRVFREYFACRMLIGGVVSYCLWVGGNAFVVLWVGKEYVLEDISFLLVVIICFINITRISDDFLAAYGLFRDIWAPIAEACVNLGLSILLGYYLSLPGVLIGALVSLVLIVLIWKPYFLCKKALMISVRKYYLMYMAYCFILLVTAFVTSRLLGAISVQTGFSWGEWIFFVFKHMVVFFLMSYLLILSFDRGMRDFSMRLFHIVRVKFSF